MQNWVFRLFWAWKIPFIALVGEKMGGREAKLWHHLLFWDERKTLSNVFTSHHFQNDASETQLFGRLFDLNEKWKKLSQLFVNFLFDIVMYETDYRHLVWTSASLHGRKSTPTPKLLGMAEAYFVCHIGPNFQISLVYMPSLGVRSPWHRT